MLSPTDSASFASVSNNLIEQFIKKEESGHHLELVLIKEETEVEDTKYEPTIKQELLLWDEPEPVEDLKALQETDAGPSRNTSSCVREPSTCAPVLKWEENSLLRTPKNAKNTLTSSKQRSKNKQFICGYCSYRTDRKSSLNRHLLTHEDFKEKKFNCIQCKFRTHDRSSLNRHVLRHQGVRERSFICKYCEYTTDNKGLLNKHLCIHEGDKHKPYVCSYCKFKTDNKSYFQKHLSIHESNRSKPFACHSCNYRTDCKGSLYRHLRLHASVRDKPFVCNYCNYRTDRKDSLKAHLLTEQSKAALRSLVDKLQATQKNKT